MKRFIASIASVFALSSPTAFASPEIICKGMAKELSEVIEQDKFISKLQGELVLLQAEVDRAKKAEASNQRIGWGMGGTAVLSTLTTAYLYIGCAGYAAESLVPCLKRLYKEGRRVMPFMPFIAVGSTAGGVLFFMRGNERLAISEEAYEQAKLKLEDIVAAQAAKKEILQDQIEANACHKQAARFK